MRMTWMILISLGFVAATYAAEPEQDHSMHGDHAPPTQTSSDDMGKMDREHMHHQAAATPPNASWAYSGRELAPQATERWEMIPVPGYGHMFVSAQNMSPELVCAALDNPGIMVDHATRQRCNLAAPAQPIESPATRDEHAGHGGH